MPSNRPNLTLDEQSFQSLLSAAFTIQEHNERLRQARQTQPEPEAHLEPETNREPEANRVCPHCGAPKPADASRCARCGLDELRPGERLQRNWASMWLMSQEQQGFWPERSPETHEATHKGIPPLEAERQPRAQLAHDFAASGILALPVTNNAIAREGIAPEETETIHHRALGKTAPSNWTLEAIEEEPLEDEATEDFRPEHSAPDDSDLTLQPFQLSASDDSCPADAETDATTDAHTTPLLQRLADVHVKLRFHRADLYLGAAVFVAALALLWPAASAPQRAALGPWERALVSLGIAEAPPPVIHLQGDPGVEVWVDPHTALYYCPGEEQYGKATDGRLTSQREAQMDRFEPAGRSACD
jgi:ribosomal protein L40E